KSDGHYLQELIQKSKVTGMEIDTVIGDTAYSGKNNLVHTNQEQIQLVAKLNPILTTGGHAKEKEFDFNKDAGMFVCPAGHMATRKARTGKKNQNTNQSVTFYFDIEKCKTCPLKEGCYKEGAKSKTYSITIKSSEHEEQAAFQETEEFKELARNRYKIEAKNSELKNPHG
ncbi:transposase, partial [Viridibacillus sp. YIM B01967]